ncbi:TIR domain-containing protein [Frankia sp. Cj5]|uniref:toll/interleukin-1 receptor domain-containing protein n=1 Tax=Frankia sp. Cj5 TaxID=2880978 RepID=UPI001EF475B4|nr:TIR domain-containing protein [Frankia sp. Cj5]
MPELRNRRLQSGAGDTTDGQSLKWDFFVSYTSADREWAEWIAWQLEAADFSVLIQAWDFVPGAHWMSRMNDGVRGADRTLAVLSHAYLSSVYGQTEWQAAYRSDPGGFALKLVPVRVEDCPRPYPLDGVVSFDLFELSVDEAKSRLLTNIRSVLAGRAKPDAEPIFPRRLIPPEPSAYSADIAPLFPGLLPPSAVPRNRSAVGTTLIRRAAIPHHNVGLSAVHSLYWSRDGRWLITHSDSWNPWKLWDLLEPTEPVHRANLKFTGRIITETLAAAWSPDGRWLATNGNDKTIRLWDMADPTQPEQRITFNSPGKTIRHTKLIFPVFPSFFVGASQPVLCWSPDGRWLATNSDDKTVRLWDMADPAQPEQRTTLNRTAMSSALCWSPDGRWLATNSDDKTVRLWDMADPAYRSILKDHSAAVSALGWSPDGRWLATGSRNKTVVLWGVANPVEPVHQATIKDHRAAVSALCWSPDSRWLATGSLDGITILWEMVTTSPPS